MLRVLTKATMIATASALALAGVAPSALAENRGDSFHSNTRATRLAGGISAMHAAPPPTPLYSPPALTGMNSTYMPGRAPREHVPGGKTEEILWFEAMDALVIGHSPSGEDQIKLTQDFNQKPERIAQWVETARKVIGNYRHLSQQLRYMPILPGFDRPVGQMRVSVSSYRNMVADRYEDSAQLLEDWIKPRRPAKTREELESQLNQLHKRADNMKQVNASLQLIDSDLRAQYSVHAPRQDDALWTYVTRKLQ